MYRRCLLLLPLLLLLLEGVDTLQASGKVDVVGQAHLSVDIGVDSLLFVQTQQTNGTRRVREHVFRDFFFTPVP